MSNYDELAPDRNDPLLIQAMKFEARLRRTLLAKFSGETLEYMLYKCLMNAEANDRRDRSKILNPMRPEVSRAMKA